MIVSILRAFLGAVMIFSFAAFAAGNERIRPRTIDELQQVTDDRFPQQRFYLIPGAEIAWIDYSALRRDSKLLKTYSDSEIDRWVLANFARVSALQLKLRGIRVSPFAVEKSNYRLFTHPSEYRRGAVGIGEPLRNGSLTDQEANLQPGGDGLLVDLKGTGQASARSVDEQLERFKALDANGREALREEQYSDGVMSLGEGIAEVTRQRALQKLFERQHREYDTSYETIESYFIIALPVDILKANGRSDRAAILGRQAHVRGPAGLVVPERLYVDHYGGRQASILESAVDFGGVLITDSALQKTFGDLSRLTLAQIKDFNPQHSNAWNFGHRTARAFVERLRINPTAAREIVRNHIDEMLAPVSDQTRISNTIQSPLFAYVRDRRNARTSIGQKFLQDRLRDLAPEQLGPLLSLLIDYVEDDKYDSILKDVLATGSYDRSTNAGRLLRRRQWKILRQRLKAGVPAAGLTAMIDDSRSDSRPEISERLLELYFQKLPNEISEISEMLLAGLSRRPTAQLASLLPRVFDSHALREGSKLDRYLTELFSRPDFKLKSPLWRQYAVRAALKTVADISDQTMELVYASLARDDHPYLIGHINSKVSGPASMTKLDPEALEKFLNIGRGERSTATLLRAIGEIMLEEGQDTFELLRRVYKSSVLDRPTVAEAFIDSLRPRERLQTLIFLERLFRGDGDVSKRMGELISPERAINFVDVLSISGRRSPASWPRLEYLIKRLFRKPIEIGSYAEWRFKEESETFWWRAAIVSLRLYGSVEDRAKADRYIAESLRDQRGRRQMYHLLASSRLQPQQRMTIDAVIDRSLALRARDHYRDLRRSTPGACNTAYSGR